MKIKLILFKPFILTFISCNNEVKIIEMKNNKECERLATLFRYERFFNDLVGRETDTISYRGNFKNMYYDHEDKFYYYGNNLSEILTIKNKNNIEILSETKSLAIKNNSENKVYNVRIKRTCQDRIKYKDYKIEPKQEICIGCDTDFDLDFNINFEPTYFGLQTALRINSYEGIIKTTHDVQYEIHEITLTSEY